MAAGLQVWDDNGNLIVDTNSQLGRVLGATTITAPNSGSITNSGLSTGTPFFLCSSLSTSPVTDPEITFSGNQLNYSFSGGGNGSYRLIYGVY